MTTSAFQISSQKLDFTNIKPKIGSLDPPKSPKASGRAEVYKIYISYSLWS